MHVMPQVDTQLKVNKAAIFSNFCFAVGVIQNNGYNGNDLCGPKQEERDLEAGDTHVSPGLVTNQTGDLGQITELLFSLVFFIRKLQLISPDYLPPGLSKTKIK